MLECAEKNVTLDGCPAGVDVACFGDDLEHSVHGDGSFDKEAGVYRLYARCRHASLQLSDTFPC